MHLSTLKSVLSQHAQDMIRFILPDGRPIPAHFHVTEVGHVRRRFIDCGGTVRALDTCLLQTWVPEGGHEHRLTAAKLARILEISRAVVPDDDLEVEVEYDCGVVGQFALGVPASGGGFLTFELANKQTDCLARETCGVEPAAAGSTCCAGAGRGCN